MKIKAIRKISNDSMNYDIQTSSKNFFANGILVHNSMITPYMTGGKLRWGTKMGLTDTAANAEAFARKNPKYIRFAEKILEAGQTPIFEWMSRKNRIVVDYPHDNLVLTAIRDNEGGSYMDYVKMKNLADSAGIDVVGALPGSVENLEKFMAQAHDLEGAEGYILRFADGHMVKIKGAWYIGLHKTKDALSQEKNVIRLIMDDSVDDAKGFMDPADAVQLEKFQRAVLTGIKDYANRIESDVARAQSELEKQDLSMFDDPDRAVKKMFAQNFASKMTDKIRQQLAFRVFDGADAQEEVEKFVYSKLGTQAGVDRVRDMIGGVNWMDFYANAEE